MYICIFIRVYVYTLLCVWGCGKHCAVEIWPSRSHLGQEGGPCLREAAVIEYEKVPTCANRCKQLVTGEQTMNDWGVYIYNIIHTYIYNYIYTHIWDIHGYPKCIWLTHIVMNGSWSWMHIQVGQVCSGGCYGAVGTWESLNGSSELQPRFSVMEIELGLGKR